MISGKEYKAHPAVVEHIRYLRTCLDYAHHSQVETVEKLESTRKRLYQMTAVFQQVLSWIENWAPDFTDDPAWEETALQIKELGL